MRKFTNLVLASLRNPARKILSPSDSWKISRQLDDSNHRGGRGYSTSFEHIAAVAGGAPVPAFVQLNVESIHDSGELGPISTGDSAL